MMQVIANALKTKMVEGKILMDEDDINLKAQLAAINGMTTGFQNPNSSASFSTFINTFQGHHDIHILSEILPHCQNHSHRLQPPPSHGAARWSQDHQIYQEPHHSVRQA